MIKRGLTLVNAMYITVSVLISDDESGLHHDHEVWLEELAPHAPIDQYWHNRTGEACPERNEGTTPTRTRRGMGRQAKPWWSPSTTTALTLARGNGSLSSNKSGFCNFALAPSRRGRRPLHSTCRSCRPTRRWTPCLQPGGPGVDALSGVNTSNAPLKRSCASAGHWNGRGSVLQASGSLLLVPQRLAAASRHRAGPRRSRGRGETLPAARRSPAPRHPAPR